MTAVAVLPELKLYGDPTFIVSTALATRDFQDVHHDRDKPSPRAERHFRQHPHRHRAGYVTDWAGPSALIKSIGLRLKSRGTPI